MIDQQLERIAVYLIPLLFAITLHEAAHGWMAKRFGDRTAQMLGRLSFNPVRHIDPLGTIIVPVLLLLTSGFIFGWAKPVPVTAANLRNPRRDMIWVAAAGPAANMLMALMWALVLGLVMRTGSADSSFIVGLFLVAQAGVLVNVFLAVFNLLPIPPLDGGRILSNVVSPRASVTFDRIEPYGMLIVFALAFTGVLWPLLQPMVSGSLDVLFAITGVG